MNWIKHYKQNHQWFTTMSKSYMHGTPKLQYWFRYPIAYVKYMIWAMRGCIHWERETHTLRNTNHNSDSHSSNKN